MNTGPSVQNTALALLNRLQSAPRRLGAGDLADLAPQPQTPIKPEPAPTVAPARPLRPGTHLDIKV